MIRIPKAPTDAIHVETKAGVVTLTGEVASQVTADRAQMLVAQLVGVRDVVNDLKYPHVASGVDSNPTVSPPADSNQ
jgi:osmotically-inducible protein OsmY